VGNSPLAPEVTAADEPLVSRKPDGPARQGAAQYRGATSTRSGSQPLRVEVDDDPLLMGPLATGVTSTKHTI